MQIDSPPRIAIRSTSALRLALYTVLCTVTVSQAAAQTPTTSSVRSAVEFLKSPEPAQRSSAAKSLIFNWKDSVPALLPEIETFDPDSLKREPTAEEKRNLLSMTDVLRTIVLNNEEAVTPFRIKQNEKTTRALTWAAASNDKDLRLNATYILATVTDNSTACIVLDNLRNPNINPSGLANLTQIATAFSAFAYDYNIDAIRDTKQIVDANTAKSSVNALTKKYLDDLVPRANASLFKGTATDSRCKDYSYKFKKAE